MDRDALRKLYDEVCQFMPSCGGSYRVMPEQTYFNIIDALANNRFIIHRENGKIVRALLYWCCPADTVEQIRHGIMPAERNEGPLVYICEHAGVDKGGRASAVAELKARFPYPATACWHDRWVQPDRFRMYRRKAND